MLGIVADIGHVDRKERGDGRQVREGIDHHRAARADGGDQQAGQRIADEAGKVKASGNTIVFRDIIPGFIEGELLLGINDNNVGDNQGHIEVIRIK